MRRFSIAAIIFAIISLSDTIEAFTSAVSWRPSSRLHSTTEDGDRIKKAGQGITVQTPGDLCFYDPNENGRMQGSDTLADRLEKGASFTVAGAEETLLPLDEATEPDTHTDASTQPEVELNGLAAETPLPLDAPVVRPDTITDRLEKGASFTVSGAHETLLPLDQAIEPDTHTHLNTQPKVEPDELPVEGSLPPDTHTKPSPQQEVRPKVSTANLKNLLRGQSGANERFHGQGRSQC